MLCLLWYKFPLLLKVWWWWCWWWTMSVLRQICE
jgi:hypothetical protein